MRERRLVSTPSVAATPLNRNTGATEDWIRWAMSITWHRCCCRPARLRPRGAFFTTIAGARRRAPPPPAPPPPPPGMLLRLALLLLYDRSTRFHPAWMLPR